MAPHRKVTLVPENRILASLPRGDYQRLLPGLKPVSLKLGDLLYEADEAIRYVYFPIKSVASFIWKTEDGATIEVGMVGSEGMTGMPVISGIKRLPYQTIMQGADGAMKMKTAAVLAEFNRYGALHDLLLQYLHGLFMQVARTAICNRIHPIQQRLCRWLLMIRDRTGSDDLNLTHEFIGSMLGARRTDVTIAAGALQKAGLIRYSRGQVAVLDAQRLVASSCDCYRISKAEFDRLSL